MPKTAHRIVVITGDHALPDPTKPGSRYNVEDEITHQAMVEAFQSMEAYAFEFWTDHGRVLRALREDPPDLVVNFCDTGWRNVPSRELNLPAYLELLEIPYTGAPPAAMVLTCDKAIVRLVAQALGVPVPREAFIPAEMPPEDLPDLYPALLKPNASDGSVGITKDAVVRTRAEALAYLAWMREALPGQDVLMQEYLPGTEYGLGFIGNPESELRMLPPMEVDYSALPAGLNPILSYESKTLPGTPHFTDIKYKRAEISEELEARLAGWGRLLFNRLGLRDYGRFDFRVAADGEPKLMEINANPAWANDGKLNFMAGFAKIAYRDMLAMILEAALVRLGLE